MTPKQEAWAIQAEACNQTDGAADTLSLLLFYKRGSFNKSFIHY